jgi:hypothetical protein
VTEEGFVASDNTERARRGVSWVEALFQFNNTFLNINTMMHEMSTAG